VFEMAVLIQRPAKCEVSPVIRFLNAKHERLQEIHKQFVVAYGKVMKWKNVKEWCREFSEGRTNVHEETKER
jgi:hypothetical protein